MHLLRAQPLRILPLLFAMAAAMRTAHGVRRHLQAVPAAKRPLGLLAVVRDMTPVHQEPELSDDLVLLHEVIYQTVRSCYRNPGDTARTRAHIAEVTGRVWSALQGDCTAVIAPELLGSDPAALAARLLRQLTPGMTDSERLSAITDRLLGI